MANEKQEISEEQYAGMVFEEGGALTVDLANVQELKFEAIPKGIYKAEVDSVDFGNSKSSGSPMFTLQIKITEGDWAGRKLYFYCSFSPKALPGTKTALMRLKPDLFDKPFQPQMIANSGELIGAPCRIKVDLEDYQGEKRSKIAALMAAGAAGEGGNNGGFFGG